MQCGITNITIDVEQKRNYIGYNDGYIDGYDGGYDAVEHIFGRMQYELGSKAGASISTVVRRGRNMLMEKRLQERLAEIDALLDTLPRGTVTYKTINGKKQPYLQWSEKGRSRSRYIKIAERETILDQVHERKLLQEEKKRILNELDRSRHGSASHSAPASATGESVYFSALEGERLFGTGYDMHYDGIAAEEDQGVLYGSSGNTGGGGRFLTRVVTGRLLRNMAHQVKGWEKRFLFHDLWQYLISPAADRVCVIYGLRRTGKTTMIKQAIAELIRSDQSNCAYIKMQSGDSVGRLNIDLQRLEALGYKYVFIDEVTLMEDFIDSAAVLSDIYAASGMKIVLSGTDSLGFWLSEHDELYDRTVTLHTTWIPFREHSLLLKTTDIDQYIRYGGTLQAGIRDFSMGANEAEAACFRDDESTRRYIDTAICRNIQHSLACNENGRHFRHLQDLYEAGELTGAINRIIEDSNHRFLLSVLTNRFRSHDYGSAADLLRKEKDPEKRTDLLDRLDKSSITYRLMQLLEIRDQEDLKTGITDVHVKEIKEYLFALDLIMNCPEETLVVGASPLEHIIFTQPGLRYAQAEALIHAVSAETRFASESERERKKVEDKILEDVSGRMMEELVLLETVKTLPRDKRAFRLDFGDGSDCDMVIYDQTHDTCSLFEIKHSISKTKEQKRILADHDKIQRISRRFGEIKDRTVLYRGRSVPEEPDGIKYHNVEDYLLDLN